MPSIFWKITSCTFRALTNLTSPQRAASVCTTYRLFKKNQFSQLSFRHRSPRTTKIRMASSSSSAEELQQNSILKKLEVFQWLGREAPCFQVEGQKVFVLYF